MALPLGYTASKIATEEQRVGNQRQGLWIGEKWYIPFIFMFVRLELSGLFSPLLQGRLGNVVFLFAKEDKANL